MYAVVQGMNMLVLQDLILRDSSCVVYFFLFFFFFQAEDGIRDYKVTGVQTCALPIFRVRAAQDPLGAEVRRAAELHDAAGDLVGVTLLLVRVRQELRRDRIGVDPDRKSVV